MNPERLLQHFDRIAAAPDSIPRLRYFILDLAVRGKLVEQDSKDEPASELLKRIHAEKARLVKEGELNKLEEFERIEANEISFSIPNGWQLIRMGGLTRKLGAGSTPLGGKSVYQNEGVPFVRSQNVYDDGLRLENVALIPRSVHEQMSGTHVQQNDVLLNITGASIGRCALVPRTLAEGNVSQHVAIIRLVAPEIRYFLHLSLISPFFQQLIDDVQVGVSREGLSMQRLKMFPMPLPPLAEQYRIVAKVEELMGLCGLLETAQKECESHRDRLVASSLNRLNNGADASEFREHARFYIDNLSCLSLRPEHVKQLRQTLLYFAFCGKLVFQDPDEGTGNDLLKKIKTAHLPSRKFGSSSKKKKTLIDPLACVGLFEVPSTWAWTYLDFVCEQIADVDHNMPKAVDSGIPFISAKDLKDDGTIDFSNPKMISEDDYERLSRKVKMTRGDIVYSRIGARLGKARIVKVDTRFLISYSCCLVRPLAEFINRDYVQKFLDSSMALSQAHIGAQSIGVPDLGLGEIKEFKIPVPPLAEQRRIVAKVDELMAICDQLGAHLITTQADSRRLLEAVLHEALVDPVCKG